VPAAYLVSSLALLTENREWKNIQWDRLESLKNFKVCDFAEGTGTLLSASCDALQYLYIKNAIKNGLDVDLEKFHRILMENIIWGFDALRYAVHIAATTLALRNPDVTLKSMNLYAVPLGEDEQGRVSLGSLEFMGKGVPTTMLGYVGSKESAISTRISPSKEVKTTPLPNRFDLILMNPPFTRATGRGAKTKRRERGLFGFITDPNVRADVLNAYNVVRKTVKNNLTRIASSLNWMKQLSISPKLKVRLPFLNIGQAGEGILFLYLAHEYVKEGGRIAFVLPRNLLSGSAWFLARALLASMFHLEYVIVSFDSKEGYNFSESTSLSETLIVARRVKHGESDGKTCFICLLRKPKTAIESVQLAHEIVDLCNTRSEELNILEYGYGPQNVVGNAIIYMIPREVMLRNIDNWGKMVSFTDPWLTMESLKIFNGIIDLGGTIVKIPIKRLIEIADIGIDRHQFHDNFEIVESKTPGCHPAIFGGGEEVRLRIATTPNAYILSKTSRSTKIYNQFKSNLLVPDRIRVNTAHITSMYTSEPLLSNIFYAVKLRTNNSKSLKSLCLWLNTTWGLMTILANREETEGAWMSLKMSHWRLLPVLDVTSLDKEKLHALEELFEKTKDSDWRRLMEQYDHESPQEERLALDLEFIKIINPNLDEKVVEGFLRNNLYPRLFSALKRWIG